MPSRIISIKHAVAVNRLGARRCLVGLALLIGWVGAASALSPLPDASPALFAGEWAGSGQRGSYCYVKVDADGNGLVLVNGGTGDWLGARMRWHNQQQNLQVDKIFPLSVSAQWRTMPLERFVFNAGFNQSLSLNWSAQFDPCQLQRVDAAARELARARAIMGALAATSAKP